MKSFLKRSAVKQLACFLLAVIITAAFVPLPAQASTEKYNYKITTLKQKKWVTAKGYIIPPMDPSNYNLIIKIRPEKSALNSNGYPGGFFVKE